MKFFYITIFACIIFFACSKKNDPGIQYTYPVVSYTLHTNFGSQVYDHSHSSVFHEGTTGFDSWWSWDNDSYKRGYVACGASSMGSIFQVNLFDSTIVPYNTTTGRDFRPVLTFSLPSINSINNYYDTAVLINIRDTAYSGHAIVSVTITGKDNNNLANPTPTIVGSFNIGGTVSNGFSPDSVDFSSSGTFTNMPYN